MKNSCLPTKKKKKNYTFQVYVKDFFKAVAKHLVSYLK